MTNEDLVSALSEEGSVTDQEASGFLMALCEVIKDFLAKKERVVITGLGSFDFESDRVRFNPSARLRVKQQ